MNGPVGRFSFYPFQNDRKAEAFGGRFRKSVRIEGNDQIGFFTGRNHLRFSPQDSKVGNEQGSNP